MLISDAYADTPAATSTATVANGTANPPSAADTPAPSPFSGMAIFLIIPVVLYFMIIRPNQRRIKEYESMVKALRRGDRVVTGGGVIGVIHKIENDEVLVVEIAPDVRIRVMRDTISNVITKTAVNDNKADKTDKSKKSDDAVNGN